MPEHKSDNKISDQRLLETADGETHEHKDFLRIRKLQLKKKGGGTLLGIDMGMDMSTQPPALIRIPARAAWRAIGLAARALHLELIIDHED